MANSLQQELENCRKHWLKAKERNDEVLMHLWEHLGKRIKRMIEEGKDEEKKKD